MKSSSECLTFALRCHPASGFPLAAPVAVDRFRFAAVPQFLAHAVSGIPVIRRPRLAASVISPLRFAITSRPSRCEEDLHLLAVEHARHTKKRPVRNCRTGQNCKRLGSA